MTDSTVHEVTPGLLAPLVEQPEPSVDGDWYAVDLRGLLAEGYTHIEFHFDSQGDETQVRRPNAASLVKAGGGG